MPSPKSPALGVVAVGGHSGQSVAVAGLNTEEQALLAEALAGRPDLEPLVHSLDAGERLSVDEANLLREAVGNEIGRTGIDDGAINERGVRLDDLIDRIAHVSEMWRA